MEFEASLANAITRAPAPLNNVEDIEVLRNDRIFVTGARGSLGLDLVEILRSSQIQVLGTDIEECDVTNLESVMENFESFVPTLIVHLAADKHAPQGELDPLSTFMINTIGTRNIIEAKNRLTNKNECRIVLASTCKSCDPETVYGASKLISERLVLNDGGNVARFYNVIETAGNVFEIWRNLPNDEPLEVTPCTRYFIHKDEAVSLLIRVMALGKAGVSERGRFSFDPGPAIQMPNLARKLYPGRQIKEVHPRRGDRLKEPLHAQSEAITSFDDRLWKVHSPHDSSQY